MKVLAIVPAIYDTSPGQRFRIEQWEPILRANGVEITYSPFETDELKAVLYQSGHVGEKIRTVVRNFNRRRQEVSSVNEFDLVYVFREAAILGPAWIERQIAKSGVPMIFDFDDAVFVAYKSPSNGYLSYLKFPGKTGTIIERSTHVMAGNSYLADYSREFNQNVTIVPTTIDTDKYTVPARDDEPDVITIGWSGSYSTVQHLDTIRNILRELAAKQAFRLRVIGTPKYELDGVSVEAMAWRSATEVQDLEDIDIGIMPLPDDKWSKGKCGLKALQYMALGIPTVCSPVGVNSEIIQNGVNGYLADGKEQWIATLSELIRSRELRRKIGLAGRRTVEEKYSAEVQAPRVLKIFEEAVEKRK